MNWFVDWDKLPKRQMKSIDPRMKRRITRDVEKAAASGNPRTDAKPLKGKFAGHSAYKIGDYRAIVEFNDAEKVVLVVKVGPRGTVYRHTKIYRVSEATAEWQPTSDDDGVKD